MSVNEHSCRIGDLLLRPWFDETQSSEAIIEIQGREFFFEELYLLYQEAYRQLVNMDKELTFGAVGYANIDQYDPCFRSAQKATAQTRKNYMTFKRIHPASQAYLNLKAREEREERKRKEEELRIQLRRMSIDNSTLKRKQDTVEIFAPPAYMRRLSQTPQRALHRGSTEQYQEIQARILKRRASHPGVRVETAVKEERYKNVMRYTRHPVSHPAVSEGHIVKKTRGKKRSVYHKEPLLHQVKQPSLDSVGRGVMLSA